MQVIVMAYIKAYDNHVEDLVKCLPMDDARFISKLSSQQLLPGDTGERIESTATQTKKALYFLSHVIKPALDIKKTENFQKLLSIMQGCGYHHVQSLSFEIKSEIDEMKTDVSGNAEYICICSEDYVNKICTNALVLTLAVYCRLVDKNNKAAIT